MQLAKDNPYFRFKPLSMSLTDKLFTVSYFLIQYLSLASNTNLHWVLTRSMGRATMSLWAWPGILKWTPTGFSVSLWQGCVAVPTCSLNLFLNGLSLHPIYWGPWTWAHWPDPLSQVMLYTTQGVRQDRLQEMGKLSPVELQVWLMQLDECTQTLQSDLCPHFLNPFAACLLHLDVCGGTLALTRLSHNELVRV